MKKLISKVGKELWNAIWEINSLLKMDEASVTHWVKFHPTSACRFEFWLFCFHPSPVLILIWEAAQQIIAHALTSFVCTWKTGMKFSAFGIALAQPWQLWPFEEWLSKWKIFSLFSHMCQFFSSINFIL